MGVGGTSDTVDGRNPIPSHLGKKNTPVNNQISTTNQLVSERHISEPATVCLFELKKKTSKKIHPPKKTNKWLKTTSKIWVENITNFGVLLGGENGSDRNDRDRKLGDWKAYLGDELQPTYRD